MAVSELPGNPNAVWTVKRHIDGEFFVVFNLFTLFGTNVQVNLPDLAQC